MQPPNTRASSFLLRWIHAPALHPAFLVLLALLWFWAQWANQHWAPATLAEDGWALAFIKHIYWRLHSGLWVPILSKPWLYIGIFIALVLQWRFPARPEQALFSRGLQADAIWSLIYLGNQAVFIALYGLFLKDLFDTHLGFLVIKASVQWPLWVSIILGYLAADFLGWLHHLLRHKVPAFWLFHAIHHSQTEMNPLARTRGHPMDQFVANSIRFIPALFFTHTLEIVLAYAFFVRFQDQLTHANIRSNWGPLRFIFVTSQSHRIHHSCEARHTDCNFGVSLSIWDRLFGTHYEGGDEYPATGLRDRDFPLEQQAGTPLALSIWRQFFYPFKKLLTIGPAPRKD